MKVVASKIMSDPVHLLAFGLGSGLSPVAPGTFGTLVATPLVVATWHLSLWPRVGIALLLLVGGTWICDASARRLGMHDYGGIVMDEIAAFYLLMLLVPAGWWWLGAGFILFRFFDVIKPWPIRLLDQHVGGGFGIMIDDVVAALFAAAVMWFGFLAWKLT